MKVCASNLLMEPLFKSTGSRFAPGMCPARHAASDKAPRANPRFVANPWAPDSLAAVRRSDSVLIVGTGLTMVDVVTTLARANHQGPIVAVSQRGLLPCEHGKFRVQ